MKRTVILTFDDGGHEHVRVDWQAKTQSGLNLTPYQIHDVDDQRKRDLDELTKFATSALIDRFEPQDTYRQQMHDHIIRLRIAAGLEES